MTFMSAAGERVKRMGNSCQVLKIGQNAEEALCFRYGRGLVGQRGNKIPNRKMAAYAKIQTSEDARFAWSAWVTVAGCEGLSTSRLAHLRSSCDVL